MINIFRTNHKWEEDHGRLFSFLLLIVLGLFMGIVVSHFQYTPDDAYIYFQYAKKIAQGKGFSFNGETPSYGTTGPLWALIIAAGIKAGLAPYAVAKSLDLAFALFAIVTMHFLSREIIRNDLYAFLATALFSFDAWLIRWSGSGMETSFAVLLAIGGVHLFLRGRPFLSALMLSCLTLTRPEGALLFGVIYSKFLSESIKLKRPLLQRIFPGLTYAAVVGAWLIFASVHFGRILPNAFYGKAAGFPNLSDFVSSSVTIVKLWGTTQFPLVAVMTAALFVVAKRSVWRDQLFLVAWVFLLPAFYLLDGVQIVSRYLLIVVPFLIVVGVLAFQHLCQFLRLTPKRVNIVVIALLSLTLVQNQIIYWLIVKPHLDSFVVGTNECLKPMGRWLRDYADVKALVFVPDVGVVGYYSDRTVCDMGLIAPEVGQGFRGFGYDSGMLQQKYNAVVHPDYVIDRSPSRARLTSSLLLPIMTNKFPGLGITNDEPEYYTLYKVVKK